MQDFPGECGGLKLQLSLRFILQPLQASLAHPASLLQSNLNVFLSLLLYISGPRLHEQVGLVTAPKPFLTGPCA